MGGVRTRGRLSNKRRGVRTRGAVAERAVDKGDPAVAPVTNQAKSPRDRAHGRTHPYGGRPNCADDVHFGDIKNLPMGMPLETPLPLKRLRVMNPKQFLSNPEPSTSTSSHDHGSVTPSTSALDATAAYVELENYVIYEEECHDSPGPSRLSECGEARIQSLPASPSHPINEDNISIIFNYGSEEDSDDNAGMGEDTFSEETYSAPALAGIPRALRDILNEVDDEEDAAPCEPTATVIWPPVTKTRPAPSTSPVTTTSKENIIKPADLFDFEWRAFPNPPTEPSLRRETFSESNVGPTCTYASPYDAFTAIWDNQIMQHICDQTNIYAEQYINNLLLTGTLCPNSRITKWQDIQLDELYTYFAMVLAMGVVVKSSINEYWSMKKDIFRTPGFIGHISVNRFELISKCLHFNNNECMNTSRLTHSQTKLYKLQPVIDHLNEKFSQLYNLSRNIALDESLTQWRGMLEINQFIRNKAASVGIKTYEICESHSGYLWRFEVHTGSEPSQDSSPVSGAIPSIVLRLLQGLENKGHTVWMDNYYNSPALARTLKSRKFDCVGTLRTNCRFVPVQLATLQKEDMFVGQVAGCTSGDVDLLVWRDKNRVALISTYHGAEHTLCRDTLKPTIVHDYNLCMGGVDKKDQMLAAYPVERKRKKCWYKKLFCRLLNSSILNAYVMYKHNTNIEHRSFRMTLIRQLMERHSGDKTKTIDILNVRQRVRFSPNALAHLPAEFGLNSVGTCKVRRMCVVCKWRTHTYCPGCNVALCMMKRQNFSAVLSCFGKYHS